MARHLVARQILEVHSADRSEGEALAARSALSAAILADAIENGLDEICPRHIRLRIDRVELDLGRCNPRRWEQELAERIRSGLGASVAQALEEGRGGVAETGETAFFLLSEFARSGRLPWWCGPAEDPESAIRALASAVGVAEALRDLLLDSRTIERLVNQLGEPVLALLLEAAAPLLAGEAEALLDRLQSTAWSSGRNGAEPLPMRDRQKTWRAVLAEAGLQREQTRPEIAAAGDARALALRSFEQHVAARLGLAPAGTAQAGKNLPDASAEPAAAPAPFARDGGPLPAREARARMLASRIRSLPPACAPEAVLEHLAGLALSIGEQSIAAAEHAFEREEPPALLATLARIVAVGEPDLDGDPGIMPRPGLRPGLSRSEESPDCASIEISGLVLLWPFLPAFFESLGLLDGDAFGGSSARHRAAAILHYLATGALEHPEQELVLPKLLTGLDVDCVHQPGPPLEPFETGSAKALIEAVLGHAPMLGRLSVEGFRRAWLNRSGSLSTRDGHWLLRIERRTFDLLLDRLPWTFGWVRLPWMADPLQVEW